MNILYQIPSLNSIYAGRTIYNGYKNAFIDLGYDFLPFTADDDLEKLLEDNKPDIFFTSTHFYYKKFLDFEILKKHRDRGMKVFVKIDFWNSPISKSRINEAKSLRDDMDTVKLIKEGAYGDVFFHVVEQNDERMDGFEKETGYKYHTILLAADKTLNYPEYSEKFKADISYIGTYLPEKRKFIEERVFPLKKIYNLRLYGQDWTLLDRIKGFVQKVGQYFNVPYMRSLQKPKLHLDDERKIYTSSLISINIHEDFQKSFGGDCNERTFKIPLCGGFEITDDVDCVRKYFKEGEEIIIAKDKKEWFEKIDHYIKYPEKRLSIIEAGRARVLADHTYHNRVAQIISIYNQLL